MIALGAASASGGEFVDVEIVMLDGVAWEPARLIELARLNDEAHRARSSATSRGPNGRATHLKTAIRDRRCPHEPEDL